jgi:hypothetical protein
MRIRLSLLLSRLQLLGWHLHQFDLPSTCFHEWRLTCL